ncbi:hypothetical protein BD309DRAFT_973544 [Dichomitus squalens]|nr:hypothetical protein BD309DRAFT_973544 [Dichomitus squalens]
MPPKITRLKAKEARHGTIPSRSLPLHTAPLSFASALSQSSSDEGSDSDEGQLKLKRFAYAASAPNPQRRTASKPISPVTQQSQTPQLASSTMTPAKAKRLPSHRFADEFPDSRLSPLSRCVSCDLAWTVRKTVKDKMTHIQSCAKKKRLTDETVSFLLRAELAKPQLVASSSKGTSPVEPSAPSAPETSAETVTEQKKRRSGLRRQVEPVVKSAAETRGDNSDKAPLLLQNTRNWFQQTPQSFAAPVDSEPAMPSPAQAFARGSVVARHGLPDIYPVRRAFGASRLGVARVKQGIIRAGAAITAESEVSPLSQVFGRSALGSAMAVDDMPPATQVFAPSKLRKASEVAGEVLPAQGDPMDEPISVHNTSEDDLDLGKSTPPRPLKRKLSLTFPDGAESRPAPVPASAVPSHLAHSPSPLPPLPL